MKEEHVITVRKNGTTYTVVLKTADGAKMAFEEMIGQIIEEAAVVMKPEEKRLKH